MAEENKHMDDAFKRLGEEFKVNYNPEFWNEAKSKLDDAMLDDAFKAAAANAVTTPSFEPTEGVDDMFMDSAFVDAASEQSAAYNPAFFEQFLENEGEIAMDEAFVEAAGAQVADYLPEYWDGADKALQDEGLHYEYQTEYWKEAKKLLDKQDRRVFFFRWSTAAAILMLISFTGMKLTPEQIEIDNMHANEADYNAADFENNHLANVNVDAAKEALEADKSFGNYTDLRDIIADKANGNDNQLTDINHDGNNHDGNNGMQDHLANNNPDNNSLLNGNVDLVNTDKETFKSLGINGGLAERNKNADELTFNKIGTLDKTPMNRLGVSIFAPEIKIEKGKDPFTMHYIGLVAESGVGNKWGEFSFLPTMRNSFGVEYMIAPGNVNLQNYEFGASFKINHIRQSQLNAEERSDVYDVHGDVTKYWRKLQLKDMVYANLNGLINYRIAGRHKLKFGIGFEYLAAVRSNMSYVDDFTADITTVNNNWGVKEGLHRFDMRFSVGYEFEISNRWSLQATSNFGAFDRTDDDFIGDINRDVELNLMLGLKYNIFGIKK